MAGQPFRVADFSGGETDYYLDGPTNCGQVYENVLITRNKKLVGRPGSEILDAVNADTPIGAVRIGKIWDDGTNLFVRQATRLYTKAFSESWFEVNGPSSELAFTDSTTDDNISVAKWNNQFFIATDNLVTPVRKIFKEGPGIFRIYSAGMPATGFVTTSSEPTLTSSTPGPTYSYVYFYHYFYEYTVDGGTTFQDVGPVHVQAKTSNVAIGGANTMTLDPPGATWPTPSTAGGHYRDAANIKIKIYRTTTNGEVGMYVGQVDAGSASNFVDNVTDANLGEEVYIAGDVLDYDPPPLAKYLVIANDICWYANLDEDGELRPYRVRQSIQFSPDKCPASFYIDVEGTITGLSAVGNLPLVFCRDRFYRLEGYVDNLGSGFTKKVCVSETVGCISNDSIIQSQRGVCFAAEDGFYFTDGYNVTKLSANRNETYPQLVSDESTVDQDLRRSRMQGAYDKKNDSYYWTVQSDDLATDNDQIWVFDARWGIKEEGCFTHWIGISPTAIAFVDNVLLRASGGFVFMHTASLLSDPVAGVAALAAEWPTTAVEYNYTSCAYAFGSEDTTKWIPRLLVACTNETNLSLQIASCNNDSANWSDLKEYRFRGNVTWGDIDVIWGDPALVWNFSGSLLIERRFPAGGLRCIYKQIRLTNSETTIIRSDDYEQATASISGATLALATEEWPTDCEGYSIYFEWDSYATGFEILTRTDSTLTLDNGSALLRDGTYKWIMRGKRKTERISLDSYTISVEMMGNTTLGYQSGQDGGNA